MSDEPIIIPEPKAIVPVLQNTPTLWQPKRALPVLGAAATLLWLGKQIVKHSDRLPVIDIPERLPVRLRRPRRQAVEIVPEEPELPENNRRRVIFQYSAQWSLTVRDDE